MSDVTDAIVVGVDGSEEALDAVRWAALVAARRNLRLHLASGFDASLGLYGDGVPISPDYFQTAEAVAQDELASAARLAEETAAGVRIEAERAHLAPVPLLLEHSRSARMIVLGASGRGGFEGMLVGSTAVSLAAHGSCPVVVVRPDREGPVVAGVDGSPNSVAALETAFDEAAWRRVPLVAVHSWSDAGYMAQQPIESALLAGEPDEDEQARVLAESLAGRQEKYPDVRVERVVVKARPRHALLDWSERASLVVVGSRGRGGFRGLLLGSTSQALIQHAKCPVMVVHPQG
ncbi:universal stress protein [Amycolatopsis acidicola]|uniref:Universal stress protein n=1 Tax=Amycolatopsis acidicola TaxID=2596893 RepID=A0A5N0UMU5_9PSEU|nr:universal stress protein [Amycolatopsis acidicola]KAA9149440.1 universal stress protein [Amycolatopsis acidicola]